jgi:transcriptional regulator with XRE-family HTH domain
MAGNEKQRNATSQAVVNLRKAMGKTQQEFAVFVLDCAISTLARYETSDPPRGEALLKLAEVASSNGLDGLANSFKGFYLGEVASTLDFSGFIVPSSEDVPIHGWRLRKLNGLDEVIADHIFEHVLTSLSAPDTLERDAATAAIKRLYESAETFGNQYELRSGITIKRLAANYHNMPKKGTQL